jgi:hypothetical protein
MRSGRIGFRLFLLVITLASLMAATAALRARVGYRLTALDHASKAQRSRALAAQFGGLADEVQKRIEGQQDSPASWRLELKSYRDRQVERTAEAEYFERLARWYER